MHRTTVYLPDMLKHSLKLTAAARGVSEAQVIRDAITAATREPSFPPLRMPLFDSGDPTLAERVEDELAGFGE